MHQGRPVEGSTGPRDASGCLARVKCERRLVFALLDSATRRANATLCHHVANAFRTFAATQRHSKFELKFVEGVHSFGDGSSDLSVRH
jgi:hypothetical protein